ncbi:MAG: hypothetical protein BGO98_40950 [Myxococcales bacterium 68-20]|nr:carboxypeptidase regulatory-like domain-containing protein [Myxococcales bacterium]OJY27637.1 MAG: hypothetical protein BGO98_40950 [Myxococcales bacterium 68-20]
MRRSFRVISLLIVLPGVVMCATSQDDGAPEKPYVPSDPPLVEASDSGGAETSSCKGLHCQVPTCTAGETTTISGTVYAPNGTLPLYNAVVYIPNSPLQPIPRGVTCDRCGTLVQGDLVASALTDTKGHFVLKNVPAGEDIPLVMQIGKWRRMIKLPKVEACKDNLADPADTATDPTYKGSRLTRLPRNQSEGDLPKIAVTTGSCDPIPCLMPKLGIDPVEYGAGFGPKAINMYTGFNGSGPMHPPPAAELWNNLEMLKKYDVVLHSCECEEANTNKGPTAWANMKAYVDLGGRLFTTDYGYTFIQKAPAPWSDLATWYTPDGWKPEPDGGAHPINQGFPKGKALAEWLDYTNGSPSFGNVLLPVIFDNLTTIDPALGTTWVKNIDNDGPKIITFNAPLGAKPEDQCGRVSFGDTHIFDMSENYVGTTFPANCKEAINDREKVIAFLFYDLTACVISDEVEQEPPPVVK